jgi:hypothetical protein
MISPSLITDTVTLERPYIILDQVAGSKRETWNPVSGSQNIPASIQPVSAQVRQDFASRQIIITHRIYTRTDLKPQRGDRIRPNKGTVVYMVTGYYNQAGRDEVYMIEAREVSV